MEFVKSLGAALLAGGLCATSLAQAPAAAGPARPRVGLVLGGGGARGAAHIGVLEVLEQLRVPVDCVAGTSMGALVAGAWAAGVSPERMRGEMTVVDWGDLFFDSTDYRELSLRNKLANAEIMDPSSMPRDRVGFGCTVVVKDLDFDDEEEYTLVGAGEEDYNRGRILATSPMGMGLTGKKVGEKAEIAAPKGTIEFEVVAIRWED
mgnify:CR=1 FL=1